MGKTQRMETVRIADEASFKRILCLERKRSERTAATFLLARLNLDPEQTQQLDVSFYFFTENDENGTRHRKSHEVLYPNGENTDLANKFFAGLKRTTDIVGSLVALVLLSPLLLLIAAGIKLSSPG